MTDEVKILSDNVRESLRELGVLDMIEDGLKKNGGSIEAEVGDLLKEGSETNVSVAMTEMIVNSTSQMVREFYKVTMFREMEPSERMNAVLGGVLLGVLVQCSLMVHPDPEARDYIARRLEEIGGPTAALAWNIRLKVGRDAGEKR